MKLSRFALVVLLLHMALVVVGLTYYVVSQYKEVHKKTQDTRLYASDGEEQFPLSFLYAVDASTGEVLTYSPVIGQIRGNGELVQTTFTLDENSTATGFSSPCNRVEASPNAEEMPFLTWTDMQDQNQHQFFTGKEVVFITEQPLPMGVDNYLVEIPTSH